jgi:hypothetical protein
MRAVGLAAVNSRFSEATLRAGDGNERQDVPHET